LRRAINPIGLNFRGTIVGDIVIGAAIENNFNGWIPEHFDGSDEADKPTGTWSETSKPTSVWS